MRYGILASKERACVADNQFRLELRESGHIALAGLGDEGGHGARGPHPDVCDPSGYSFALTSSRPIEAGRWTHVVVARSQGVYTLYLNGALDARASLPVASKGYKHENDLDLRIGSRYAPGVSSEAFSMLEGDIRHGLFTWSCLKTDEIELLAHSVLRRVGAM